MIGRCQMCSTVVQWEQRDGHGFASFDADGPHVTSCAALKRLGPVAVQPPSGRSERTTERAKVPF